ncbi:WbqC family protein [Microvirga alba]|uniref:WbqC family protein n=1 Tax=Microvirga alba TaxID=2791025 RepID=A0A931BJE2_9HYPH|nr:WbqC family protein [Microvirga alba]MBF9231986.1 WbqC family protein [Microvirga alba]
MGRVVAIHQPNFFPWLGYFDKIRQADVFIFLDAVDYPRSGSGGMGSWVNRVRLNIQGKEHWVGCPVKRLPLGAPISAAEIDDQQPWRLKLLRSLQANYGRAEHFKQVMDLLGPLIDAREFNLARFNIAAISSIASYLGLSAEFVLQSQLSVPGESTERLIALTKAVGGDTYLTGGGASGYQIDNLFPENGLSLRGQSFTPRPYGPPEKYIAGLSIIDYLMHDGRPFTESFAETAAQ